MVDLEHTLQFHVPILSAIEQRDSRLAQRLMTDHLNDARDLLLHARDRDNARQLREHLAAEPRMPRQRRSVAEQPPSGYARVLKPKTRGSKVVSGAGV